MLIWVEVIHLFQGRYKSRVNKYMKFTDIRTKEGHKIKYNITNYMSDKFNISTYKIVRFIISINCEPFSLDMGNIFCGYCVI